MITNAVHQSASDKAFAKITMLLIDIEQNKEDIRSHNYGGLTLDEMNILIMSNKRELKVWQYIAKLIETNEK
jgi:hypothetical protein